MVAFYWDNSITAINLKMWQKIAFTRIQTPEYTKGYTHALSCSTGWHWGQCLIYPVPIPSLLTTTGIRCLLWLKTSPPSCHPAKKVSRQKDCWSRSLNACLWTGTEGSKKWLMRAGKVGCQVTQEKEHRIPDCAARQGRRSQDTIHRDVYEKDFVVQMKIRLKAVGKWILIKVKPMD